MPTWNEFLNLINALSTSQEGTSPYIMEKAQALNNGDMKTYRTIRDKEGDLARKAFALQTLALGPVAAGVGAIPTTITFAAPEVVPEVVTNGATAVIANGGAKALLGAFPAAMYATKYSRSSKPNTTWQQYENQLRDISKQRNSNDPDRFINDLARYYYGDGSPWLTWDNLTWKEKLHILKNYFK